VTDKPLRVIGRYALYEPLASGGMATVHLGRLLGPVGFSRTVAIKRLHEHYTTDPEFVSSFLDEARIAARIRHPNVVPTLDVVATDGQLFLVMEYVQGESLSRLLKATSERKERVPQSVAVTISVSTLHGLHAAHEATSERGDPLHIVHRDVSPQNVMVGVDGVARVVDFGVAKAIGRLQDTREGQLKGKIAYMSPEQLRSEAVDRRTDVYAAAVVLWETLTTKRLFSGENDGAVLNRILMGTVEPPSARAPDISPALDAIVMRGLARDPSARWSTAREMALALEAVIAPATPTQIGAWVDRVASASLATRAAHVAEIESGSIPEGRASAIMSEIKRSEASGMELLHTDRSMSTPAGVPSRSRAAIWAIAALSLVVGGIVTAFVIKRATTTALPSAPIKLSAASDVPSAPSIASLAPVVSIASVAPIATPTNAPSATASVHVQKHTPAAPVPSVDCSTPFTYDEMGRKVYKKECIE
jgi:serine/threonine-protein kinase